MIITSSETKSKKYKQRQKWNNGLIALNYLKANLVYGITIEMAPAIIERCTE